MLEGIIRLQHQATTVQFSDILTKSLGKKLHRKHRRVLFGQDPVEIISIALPESQKTYIRRHNELIQQRKEKERLRKAFENETERGEDKVQAALAATAKVFLALAS